MPNFSIHRANLIGMGVLPLGLTQGTTRLTPGLNGSETYAVIGERQRGVELTFFVQRQSGETLQVPR